MLQYGVVLELLAWHGCMVAPRLPSPPHFALRHRCTACTASVYCLHVLQVLKYTLADVQHVICVSHTSKENTVLRACIPPSRVSVIPNGGPPSCRLLQGSVLQAASWLHGMRCCLLVG